MIIPGSLKKKREKAFIWAILFFIAVIGGSCKARYSFTGADIPAEAETLSVVRFPNRAPLADPSLSQDFTEALRNIFLEQTSLELVEKKGDLQYSGQITGYNVEPVAVESNEQAAMNRLTIEVQVNYTNTLDPDKSFQQTFSRFADFQGNKDLSEVEEELVAEINDQLVQDIFDQSLSNW